MPFVDTFYHPWISAPIVTLSMESDNYLALAWNKTWNMSVANLSIAVNTSEEGVEIPKWKSKESAPLKALEMNIHVIGLPVIIFVGLIGNLVSLTVFCGTHMRYQSSSVYLIFLNLVDIVFLLCLMVIWLAWIDVNLIHINGWCQGTIYLTYVSSFLSVWAVVSFSMERFIVVFFPLKRQAWCTRKLAIKVTLALLLVSVLLYSFALWTTGIELAQGGLGSMCRWRSEYNLVMTIMIPLDSVVTFVIPSTAIAILNCSITLRIWKFVLKRQGKLQVCPECGSYVQENWDSKRQSVLHSSFRRLSKWRRGTLNSETNISMEGSKGCCKASRYSFITCSRQGAQQLRTTRTLLMLSTVFVLLHTPSHVFRFYIIIHQLHSTNIQTTRAMKLSQNITQILYYANFASNFFLYCTFSKLFRDSLARAVVRCKRAVQKRIEHLCGRPSGIEETKRV